MRFELRFILIGVGLLVLLGLLLSFYWNANHYFTGAYSTVIQSNSPAPQDESSGSDNAPSSQPHPAGFSERDIEKQRGNGYATY